MQLRPPGEHSPVAAAPHVCVAQTLIPTRTCQRVAHGQMHASRRLCLWATPRGRGSVAAALGWRRAFAAVTAAAALTRRPRAALAGGRREPPPPYRGLRALLRSAKGQVAVRSRGAAAPCTAALQLLCSPGGAAQCAQPPAIAEQPVQQHLRAPVRAAHHGSTGGQKMVALCHVSAGQPGRPPRRRCDLGGDTSSAALPGGCRR